jgi:hypothetical protein
MNMRKERGLSVKVCDTMNSRLGAVEFYLGASGLNAKKNPNTGAGSYSCNPWAELRVSAHYEG